jgi:hypothetical protein
VRCRAVSCPPRFFISTFFFFVIAEFPVALCLSYLSHSLLPFSLCCFSVYSRCELSTFSLLFLCMSHIVLSSLSYLCSTCPRPAVCIVWPVCVRFPASYTELMSELCVQYACVCPAGVTLCLCPQYVGSVTGSPSWPVRREGTGTEPGCLK